MISKKSLYFTSDRAKVVEEGDPDAAFLLVRAGSEIDDATAKRYGLTGEEVPVYDAIADHEAKHGGETDEQAAQRRTAMLAGEPDPDGTPVQGERDDVKGVTPTANKAIRRVPEDK